MNSPDKIAARITALEGLIVTIVNGAQGMKATELALVIQAGSLRLHIEFDTDEFFKALSNVVASKKIVEIDYVLPAMDYRTKSFLLPGGTKVRCFTPLDI